MIRFDPAPLHLLIPPPRLRSIHHGFTQMELLVVVAILLVVGAILLPVMNTVKNRKHRAIALAKMGQIGITAGNYAAQNNDELPDEGPKGVVGWAVASKEECAKAWFNVLPVLLGHKSVAQYSSNPVAFYTEDNVFYLPAAEYPVTDRRLREPLFAMAMNTKLQRKDADEEKHTLLLKDIVNPLRTVLFFERGLRGELRPTAGFSNYDGSPKGSAKSFVARYGGKGVVAFADGHAELMEPGDVLEVNGQVKFPPGSGDLIWCKTPEEDPN